MVKEMVFKRDYYVVLNVSKHATQAEITKSYRSLALKHHPDRNRNTNQAQFQEIVEAYEVLSDEEKRKKYDEYGYRLKPFNDTSIKDALGKLGPMFFAAGTGILGGTLTKIGYLETVTMILWESVAVAISCMYFFRADKKLKPEDQITTVSDYLTVAGVGLAVGNLGGWISGVSLLYLSSLFSF